MLSEKDIYEYLKYGGSIDAVQKVIARDVEKIQNRIKEEKAEEQKEKELANKINKARAHAFKSLKNYFALVNPEISDETISAALDTLETVEVRINGVAVHDDKVFFTDEEMKKIWNALFPFSSKRK